MNRSMLLNAVSRVLPAGVSQAIVAHDAQRDGTWKEQASEWLKERCRDVYHSSVYCSACDHEIGANPECPQCVKASGREQLQTSVPRHGRLT